MKYTALAFCLLPVLAAAETSNRTCLNGRTGVEIPLDLAKGRYIEGNIRFSRMDFSRDGVTLSAVSDGLERSLFRNQTEEQNFLLWLPYAKRAFLRLEAPQNRRLCYEWVLKQGNAAADTEIRENAAPQSLRLQALQRDLRHNQNAAAEFWRETAARGAPLIEPADGGKRLLTFVYRGAQTNVRLIGAPSNDHEWLERLPGSDVWYKSFTVPAGLRLSYRLAPDVPVPEDTGGAEKERQYRKRRALLAVDQPDPLNPHRFGEDSLVDLNTEVFSDGLKPIKGRLKQYAFHSKILGNTRRVWIYQTDGQRQAEPVWLYLFDGYEYLTKTQLPAVLDRLRAQGSIPPVTAVFIDNHRRSRELPANAEFADMLAEELVPFAEQQTRRRHQRESAVIAGSSYGGLAAAYIALRHPQLFGKVMPMSGSFWWKDAAGTGIKETVAAQKGGAQYWYIAAGSYETARAGETADQGIAFSSRQLAETLREKNYPAVYREYAGGHDYAVWQKVLADGLVSWFGR